MNLPKTGIFYVVAYKDGDIKFTYNNIAAFNFNVRRLFMHMNDRSLLRSENAFENTAVLALDKEMVFSELTKTWGFSDKAIKRCEKRFEEGYDDYALLHIEDYDVLTEDLFRSLVSSGKIKVLCASYDCEEDDDEAEEDCEC